MKRDAASLESVIDGLEADGLLSPTHAGQADALLARLHAVQPWYIRTMVGCGAWLASLLLLGFVGGFGLALGGSSLIGLALVAAAAWLRRRPGVGDNDFVVQSTLATSLAGQALFCWGVAEMLPGDGMKIGCVIVMAVSTALFFVFPDRIHRVLMVLIATSALVTWIYLVELNVVVPLIGPLFATALVLLYWNRGALTAAGHGRLVRPLANGLMLSAFGCLLLSTIYVLPELGVEFSFYPRPWISTLLLGGLFLHVGSRTWPALLDGAGKAAAPVVYLLMLLVIAAAWAAPGLLLALTVIMLGTAAGHRTFTGAGIAFLAVFVAAYFYGIEVTMLTKSITLVGSGVTILFARWLLVAVLGAPRHG